MEISMKDLRDLLCAAPAPTAHAPPAHLLARHIDRWCVVRSHLSGVWLGVVVATDGRGVVLGAGARRAWSWAGAGSCSGLATVGPNGGKITAPTAAEVTIAEVVEVITASNAAVATWAAVPVWTGR